MDQFRNKIYWDEIGIGKWKFKESKFQEDTNQNKKMILNDTAKFIENNNLDMGKKSKYIIFGKGYP